MLAGAGCGFGNCAGVGKCHGILALAPQDEHGCAWGARYFANAETGVIDKALGAAAQGARSQLDC